MHRNNKHSGDQLSNRHILEALYVTLNLGNTEAIARGISLSNAIKDKHGGLVRKCIDMSQLYHARLYYRVMHQMHRLPPIIAGVAALRMQTMRRYRLIFELEIYFVYQSNLIAGNY